MALGAEGCIYAMFASGGRGERLPDGHPEHPDVRIAAAPVQFDDALPVARRAGPTLGQHSREVLTELSYGSEAIQRLINDDVVIQP